MSLSTTSLLTITIPKHTILYRADDDIKPYLTPQKCPDTGKKGVYFSSFTPYHAETRCTERMKDQMISVYYLTSDIVVSDGKYAFTCNYTHPLYPTTGWEHVQEEDNISHFDDSLWSLDPNVIEYGNEHDKRHSELFLTFDDLKCVTFDRAYLFTVGECIRKWYKQSWFETMVDQYVLPYRKIELVPFVVHNYVDDSVMYVKVENDRYSSNDELASDDGMNDVNNDANDKVIEL